MKTKLLPSLALCLSLAGAPLSRAEEQDLPALAAKIGDVFQRAMEGEPLRRPVFGKDHGCLKGEFKILDQLPARLKVGVFATPRSYPAWIRFANDGSAFAADQQKGARGMSVKLVGVGEPGDKILEGEKDALTQDFVMQNHPVFFTDDAADFLEFLTGTTRPETQSILDAIDARVLADPLDGQYWTPTPYAFGPGRAMKYMAKPCSPPPRPETKPMSSPAYLRENLVEHLRGQDACFNFYVQLQGPASRDPIDRATVRWKGKFHKVATLTIPKGQDVDAPARKHRCESMSFTGWHAIPEHRPLGSINEARGIVYKRSADIRAEHNRASHAEPVEILPTE